jgi:2-haloalkanoic acid dehalogenase type II
MPAQAKAILFDALGTLLTFEPPAPHLQAALRARGHEVSLEAAHAAIGAEIAYYRAHLDEGRDEAAVCDLRRRCAAAMAEALPGIDEATLLEALMDALRFHAYPDVIPALQRLWDAGIRLVVVSNWDWSLHERLHETGIAPLLDGALASAEVGVAKPDPEIFERALKLAGVEAHEAWFVGDTPAVDVEGARAAGLTPVLIAREGERPKDAISSLSELIPLALPQMIDELPPPPPPKQREVPIWAPFAALLGALVVIATFGAVVIGLYSVNHPGFDADEIPIGLTLGLTALQDAAFVFGAWIAVRLSLGSTPASQFGLNPVRKPWQALGWAVLIYVGFWTVTLVLTAIFGEPSDQELVSDVKNEDTLGVLIAYGVLICLIAPFVEELFFRGFMFTVLRRRLGVAWSALIVGFVFGLGHAPAPAISLIALGVFGVGLCLLYWRTESIIPGMALHALNNSITFGAVKSLDPAMFAGVVVLSVGAVVAAGTAVSSRSKAAA